MRTLCWANGLFLGFVFLSCLCPLGHAKSTMEHNDVIDVSCAEPSRESGIVSANTSFGFKLFAKLVEQDTGKNIFISPSSVAIALAMIYIGLHPDYILYDLTEIAENL